MIMYIGRFGKRDASFHIIYDVFKGWSCDDDDDVDIVWMVGTVVEIANVIGVGWASVNIS